GEMMGTVGEDFGAGGDPALGDLDSVSVLGESADVLVCAGEGVDAVVVASVWEGAELVEERLGVLVANDADEAVAGCGGDGLGADEFGAGDAVGAGVVAAEEVAGV